MKPALLSGVQPTGRLHLGNYLGALKNFVELQNSGKYECHFFIADLHSLTEPFDQKDKPKQILELTADFLAAGLDPKKSVIFQQSQIPAHTELGWIFETIAPLGELSRMTQFREKVEQLGKNLEDISRRIDKAVKDATPKVTHLQGIMRLSGEINTGLLTYPILMSADILLYDPRFVPVGNDQDQHLELTRMLARKFNKKFGDTFTEPQPLFTETPRVMGLADPEKKMSKSQPESCIFLDDSPEEIRKKMKRAVTDSGSEIKFAPEKKAGISNLLKIYSSLSGEPVTKLEKRFAGKTYSEFKNNLAELIADHFADYRAKKKSLLAKPQMLKLTLRHGSGRAAKIAARKIAEVKKKVGLTI